MDYSPSKMKKDIKESSFNFKKKYGQNFIIDKNVIESIIKKSDIDKNTLVIEIGPGAGSLTSELEKVSKKVIAYEIDKTIKPILTNNITKAKIIYDDFLKRNVKDDIKNEKYDKLYVISNLPYYITTPIIVKLIEEKIEIDKMILMVQKEVGDRFKAHPNTKEYNSLTIFINYYFTVEKILDISKNVFMPKPNVDSIVIKLEKKQRKKLKNESVFFKLIRDSFKQKRKTLKNNLKGYDLETIEKVLKRHNLDLTVRAEALPVEIFIEMSECIGGK